MQALFHKEIVALLFRILLHLKVYRMEWNTLQENIHQKKLGGTQVPVIVFPSTIYHLTAKYYP